MAMKRAIFFYLDKYMYGRGIEKIKGIEAMLDYIPVPSSLANIKGLLNLRGEVIPVYSLRTKLGLAPGKVNEETQLVIGKLRNGILLALEVDQIQEILDVEEENFTNPPALINSESTGYISKVVHVNGTLAIMLDLDGMLTEEEKRNIQKFIEDSQKKEEEEEEPEDAEEEITEEDEL